MESLEIVEGIDDVGRTTIVFEGVDDTSSLDGDVRSPGELPLYQETMEPEEEDDNLHEVSATYVQVVKPFLSECLKFNY